jgi:hypothetical protein
MRRRYLSLSLFFFGQNDVEALASKLPPSYATITYAFPISVRPYRGYFDIFYRPFNLTSFFPISVSPQRGISQRFATDHGTSHMLSEFLCEFPNGDFFFVRTMWKPWLPTSYATELALSIGSKEKPQIHLENQYLGLRFKRGEIDHAFFIHDYLICVCTGLLLWFRYQNIQKKVYMLFVQVFEDYARIQRRSHILDVLNF